MCRGDLLNSCIAISEPKSVHRLALSFMECRLGNASGPAVFDAFTPPPPEIMDS
jgi:hypothetical protein